MASPRYGPSLRQTVRQEMQLQPRMLQSIEVLQLPGHELEAYLLEAAQENEALRVERPVAPRGGDPFGPRRGAEATERHGAWLESQEAPPGGLLEALEEQLSWLDLEPRIAPWVRLVVELLDDRGYLSLSDEALLEEARARGLEGGPSELGRAIALVQQRFEPRGIGGRDLIEALLLQLDPNASDYELLCRLVEEFLDELARNKLPAVARELGIELSRLDELLARLRHLDPIPARGVGGASPPPIHPEVIVERSGDGYRVRIDDAGLPAVSIDPAVKALASDDEESNEVRRYLREKLDRARWLVEALEQRKRTLQRIATHVFHTQWRFLEKGPRELVPLTMGQVADDLGIHLSTVSRGVAGKYAETPWGVFPMKSFFPQAAPGQVEGAVRDDAREAVRAIVAEEDPARPLSDDEIVGRMKARGFDLARRTVAKYRKELGIPSSYRRRRFA